VRFFPLTYSKSSSYYFFLPFGVCHRILAQESTATIVGQVTEASGAVIPNAAVHIKNVSIS
jgi:hypothetical protein